MKKLYYQKTDYPTFIPLGLFMPGGNRKTNDPTNKLHPRIEKNGITYNLYDSKGNRIINIKNKYKNNIVYKKV
jgi:hypothetical protein